MKSYEWRENILQQKREEAIGKTELPLLGRIVDASEDVIAMVGGNHSNIKPWYGAGAVKATCEFPSFGLQVQELD